MIEWGQKDEVVNGLKQVVASAGRFRRSYVANQARKSHRVRMLSKARNEFAKDSERILRKIDAEITRIREIKEVWRE